MIRLDFLSHIQHCCHMETDCRGQHTQLKLVVLEIKFSIVLLFFLKKMVLTCCFSVARLEGISFISRITNAVGIVVPHGA